MSESLYSMIWKDKFGIINTVYSWSAFRYHFSIRGVLFEPESLVELSLPESLPEDSRNLFEAEENRLVQCEILADIPLQFFCDGKIRTETAQVSFFVKDEDYETSLSLCGGKNVSCQTGKTFSFEHALIDLQHLLPSSCKLNACISCKYSSFSPCGNDGYLIGCFRQQKNTFRQVKDKGSCLEAFIRGRVLWFPVSYVCEEYERITKSDWVYSDWK